MTNPVAPLVFLDTETDDLDSKRRQPWDVALIRREPDGRETTHQFYVELDLSDSDPFALKVGHFWERHPLGIYYAGGAGIMPQPVDNGGLSQAYGQYLTERAAAVRVARITHGAHVVGAIPSFDTITLETLLRNHAISPQWHYHIVDVEALSVGFIRGQHGGFSSEDPSVVQERKALGPPWKSEDLSSLLGVSPPTEDERHTALGDARWAMRIYDTVMGTARDANGRVAA